MRRISSLDNGYRTGDLSLFPDALDDRDSLYRVHNNAETKLRSGLSYNSKQVVVESTDGFPEKGLIRVGAGSGIPGESELIYYGLKTDSVFKELTRGFSGSRQGQWPSGSWVTNSVAAEPHNALKDAIIKMELSIGLKEFPEDGTLNRRLKNMETRFLSPKATFRAFPRNCKPGVAIRFQSLCEGDVVRYLWDFGDGSQQSTEQNPVYAYSREGNYTVKLHIVTATGAQGISKKENYVSVSENNQTPFFYVTRVSGRTYRFIDQTDGDVTQRFWVFGDEGKYVESDPNVHEHVHTYADAGTYNPSLIVGFADQSIKRVFLTEKVVVV